MADDPQSELPPVETIDAGSQALSEALRSSFGIVKFVMVLLVLVFLGSGFFKVEPHEQAMIIRLGDPVRRGQSYLLGPGLHWAFPYPIDEYIKVPIAAIQRVRSTVGWYATTPAQEATGTDYTPLPTSVPINPLAEGYALTADNNIVHTRATLTYHIEDPVSYVFNFVNASNTVQSALDNALLETASGFKVDDILYRDVSGFKDAVRKRITQLAEQQKLGIAVEEVVVESRAPRQLKDAFDSVLQAEVGRQKALNTALTEANQITNRASADAQSRINFAESERATLVKEITGEADRFSEVLPEFLRHPALFEQQRLTETIGRVLTNAQDKIFLTEGVDGKPKELRLLLNREVIKPKTEETKP